MARPTKFTPELAAKILQLVETGCFASVAAQAVGLSPATFHRWVQRGKAQRRGQFRDFCDGLTRARAKARGRMVTIVSLAAEQDWRAAAYYLERTDPKRWGRRDKLAVDGQLRHKVERQRVKPDLSVLSDEELEAYHRILEKLGATVHTPAADEVEPKVH